MIDITQLRLQMLANGYQPLPALGKAVLLKSWSSKITITSSEITAWGEQYPQWGNTGTLTGHTPAIDADIHDPAAAQAFEELARDFLDGRGPVLVRTGAAPKRAILCRTTTPFAKISASFTAPNGSTHKIEVLGLGQQIVVAGVHPDTQQPYRWHGGEPWTVPWTELPEITEAEARGFVARAATMLEQDFGFVQTSLHGNGHTAGFIATTKAVVDVEQELVDIHHGNIHETWLRCMGSLLRAGTPANDTLRRLKQATEQAPRCQDDPKKKSWAKQLAEMVTWYARSDSAFIGNLEPKQQDDWHTRLVEGRTPRLVWRDDHGLQVRGDGGSEPTEKIGNAGTANNAGNDPTNAPGPKFKLLHYCDLRPGVNDQDYRVDELLPMEGLVIVWGKFKCLKTFWVYDLALHIAKGWEYRDRAVRQGMVIYCAFEGAHGFRKRTEAQRRHYELADDDDVPLHVMPCQMNLIKDHGTFIKDIAAQLKNGDRPAVVVLDTLNRSLVGSESKDADMANYIAAASAIREAFSCLVIIVHHCGWDESRPRGHSSLPGAVEGQLAVVREGDRVTVLVEFLRDGPEGTEIHSVTKVIEVGQDATGKKLTSLVVVPSNIAARKDGGWAKGLLTLRRALNTALVKYGEAFAETPFETPVRAVAVEEVRKEFYAIYVPDSGGDADQRQDSKRKKFNRDLKQAQDEHLVLCREPEGRPAMVWLRRQYGNAESPENED